MASHVSCREMTRPIFEVDLEKHQRDYNKPKRLMMEKISTDYMQTTNLKNDRDVAPLVVVRLKHITPGHMVLPCGLGGWCG